MLSVGNVSVCVVESTHGMNVEAYKSRFAAVLAMLDNGAIGNGVHGNRAHRAALITVSKRIAEMVAEIDAAADREDGR